ncbi:hypothetical protein [Frankia sp. Cj3]|uniref:hypothetical protein n=1 Tax=Frankia sp. Cj3 TaxID=2880976 RepID=UPI001EF55264|nr:hypothetical protein [Frankia sp. Cj3]
MPARRPSFIPRLTASVLLAAAGAVAALTTAARALQAHGRRRWDAARAEPDAGYSTEATIIIALLVALAITVVGIISAKVIAKAHSISFL